MRWQTSLTGAQAVESRGPSPGRGESEIRQPECHCLVCWKRKRPAVWPFSTWTGETGPSARNRPILPSLAGDRETVVW